MDHRSDVPEDRLGEFLSLVDVGIDSVVLLCHQRVSDRAGDSSHGASLVRPALLLEPINDCQHGTRANQDPDSAFAFV